MGAFAKSNQIAAAWVNVEPLLAAKKRGEDVTRAEVVAAAKMQIALSRLDEKIRRHFLKRGIDLVPIIGAGWHIPTDEEQVRLRAEHHRTRARRATRRELHAAVNVDATALSPTAQRERDLHIRHAGAAIDAQVAVSSERRAILGAPPARPRLLMS